MAQGNKSVIDQDDRGRTDQYLSSPSLFRSALFALALHTILPLGVSTYDQLAYWLKKRLTIPAAVGRHIDLANKEMLRVRLLQQARSEQNRNTFRLEHFIPQAEAIETSISVGQVAAHLLDQDSIFAEVQVLISERHLSHVDAVRRVTVERYLYEEGQGRVTKIRADQALNCASFTLQAAMLFTRLRTPGIYVEAFKPWGDPPVPHVTLVMKMGDIWYDIRDGSRTITPDVSKLVPLNRLLDYYVTANYSRQRLLGETEHPLFEFPQQNFSYPGGVVFRQPPLGMAQWHNSVAQNTSTETGPSPSDDEEFYKYIEHIWLTDFVHQVLVPPSYGSIRHENTSEIDFIPNVSRPVVPDPSTFSAITAADLPANPIAQTAEDATAYARVFNQAMRRLDQAATNLQHRAVILSQVVRIAQTRLERANDLSASERQYLRSVIHNARTQRAVYLRGERLDNVATLSNESSRYEVILESPNSRQILLRESVSAEEIQARLRFWGLYDFAVRLAPFLFFRDTQTELLQWATHQGPTIQLALVVALRNVLKTTVHADAELEARILHHINLDQNPLWTNHFSTIAPIMPVGYDQFSHNQALLSDLNPLFSGMIGSRTFNHAQRIAYTLQLSTFLMLPAESGSPREQMQSVLYSAWYHHIGATPPAGDRYAQILWDSVTEMAPPLLPEEQLVTSWNTIQAEVHNR